MKSRMIPNRWEEVYDDVICDICAGTKKVDDLTLFRSGAKRRCAKCKMIYCIPCAFEHYESLHVYLLGVVL